jgi:hypothetical protein
MGGPMGPNLFGSLGSDMTTTADPVPDRHCGRCQGALPADPDLFFQSDWSLCLPCRTILLPGRTASPPKHPIEGSASLAGP